MGVPVAPDDLHWEEAAAREVALAAAELGTTARQVIPAFPFVVVGEVGGRAYYLKERSEVYEVVVAPDATPRESPWSAGAGHGITVVAGVSDDLLQGDGPSPARAVHVAVGAVRAWLRRRACTHNHDRGDRYCRHCGLALVDPALP